MRILGVDPGSRLTGYGCIDKAGNQLHHVAHGTLRLASSSKTSVTFEDRLLSLYEGLSAIILELKPTIMVVEKVFFAKNPLSALKLGQARGATLLTGKIHSLNIVEYNPTAVKRAVVGHGHAQKEEVAKMIQLLIGKRTFETPDASDALALAICHAFISRSITSRSPELAAALNSGLNRRSKKKLSMAESVGISHLKKI
jgi:crossover junction endodeoxyribonuclease RuvC